MPDTHGSDVLARLKADPRTAGIPVIVLSADASPGQEERTIAAAAHAYLAKPLEIEGFLAAVRGCLYETEAVPS